MSLGKFVAFVEGDPDSPAFGETEDAVVQMQVEALEGDPQTSIELVHVYKLLATHKIEWKLAVAERKPAK